MSLWKRKLCFILNNSKFSPKLRQLAKSLREVKQLLNIR